VGVEGATVGDGAADPGSLAGELGEVGEAVVADGAVAAPRTVNDSRPEIG
jgi:hypothetical protein